MQKNEPVLRDGRRTLSSRSLAAIPCLLLAAAACAPDGNLGNAGSRGSAKGGSGGSPAGSAGSGGARDHSGGAGGRGGSVGDSGGGGSTNGSGGNGGVPGGSGGSSAGGGSGGGAMSGGGGTGGSTAPSDYQVFFGSTHAHSDFSHNSHEFPGTDSAEEGFTRAKAAGADFYFITDHVDSGSITPEQFNQVRAAADQLTDASFVASAGIEFHLDSNEANAFNLPELTDEHIDKVESLTGAEYADFLKQYPGAFMQWDHPNRDSVDFGGWSEERDRVIALVEVINDLYGDISETGYLDALDAGWHVGPGAGHDNHGEAWFEPDFRTGVLATSLTRDNIHEAIRQQRVFATQEKALKVWYDINGTIMGSVMPSASTYTATVRAEGATVSKVEILTKAGKVVTSGTLSGGVWSTELTGVSAGSYYFARLTSGAGKTWTAPVWLK